jgi:hypothetical protein
MSRATQLVEEGLVGRLPLVWPAARPQLPAEFDGKFGKTGTALMALELVLQSLMYRPGEPDPLQARELAGKPVGLRVLDVKCHKAILQ